MISELLLVNSTGANPVFDWTAIIIAFITIVVGGSIGTRIVNWLLDTAFNRKITAAEAVRINLNIAQIIEHLRQQLDAHSVVVIETENGEKLSRPGQLMFVTMTAESVKNPIHSTQARWIEVPVDLTYNHALRHLLESSDGIISYTTDEFPSRTLKDMYIQLGVKRSILVRIPSKPNYIRYMSIRLSEDVGEPEPVTRSILTAAAQKLSQMYT